MDDTQQSTHSNVAATNHGRPSEANTSCNAVTSGDFSKDHLTENTTNTFKLTKISSSVVPPANEQQNLDSSTYAVGGRNHMKDHKILSSNSLVDNHCDSMAPNLTTESCHLSETAASHENQSEGEDLNDSDSDALNGENGIRNRMEYGIDGSKTTALEEHDGVADAHDTSSDVYGSSLNSSNASRKSMPDESCLPPRKRKQHMSNQKADLEISLSTVPPKKRGRPKKEVNKASADAKIVTTKAEKDAACTSNSADLRKHNKPSKEKHPSAKKKKILHAHKSCATLSVKLPHSDRKTNISSRQSESPPCEKGSIDSDDIVRRISPVAVKVTPPKKPKASVAEMQKALMKVVGSSAAESLNCGKRKRGRPPGSRNKKKIYAEHRARSSSGSMSCKEKSDAEKSHVPKPLTIISPKMMAASCDHNLSVISPSPRGHVATKLKSPSLSPMFTLKSQDYALPTVHSSWLCVFCHQISNFQDMGDLFGGYIVQPGMPLSARILSHKKSAVEQQRHRSVSVGDSAIANNEVWFHQKCIVWAPRVYMMSGKIYGVYEAIHAALTTVGPRHPNFSAILITIEGSVSVFTYRSVYEF